MPAPRKKSSKASKAIILIFKFILILIFLNFSARFKPIFIIAAFEILDFFKNIVKQSIQYFPLDLVFIFGITGSYYYSPWVGVTVFLLGVINRAVMSSIEFRHLSKGVRHIPLFFVTQYLHGLPFFTAAMTLLVSNYVLKYILKIATYQPLFDKSHYNTVNFVLATIMFYLLSMIYYYFPFLA